MVASYPNSTRAFVARVDRVDINAAQDINDLQEEVVAIQQALGRNPATSETFPATDVGSRLALFEANVIPRVATLENRLKRAAVTVNRTSSVLYSSSANFQALTLPDTVVSLNDYGTALSMYDGGLGRFYSVAPSPGIWSLTATVTFESVATAVGLRGLAFFTAAGSVLAMDERLAFGGEDQTISLSWLGRLPVDPTSYVTLAVKQSQGTAVSLRGDTASTPLRADYTHLPG